MKKSLLWIDEQLFFTSDKKQDIKQNNLFFSWLLNIKHEDEGAQVVKIINTWSISLIQV